MAGYLGSSGIQSIIAQAYKTYVNALASMTGIPDINYSPGSTTTYNINNNTVWIAKNITVGANATIIFGAGATYAGGLNLIVCDTLNLNGIIHCEGAVSGGAGNVANTSGGAGASNLIIIARQITGTGTIRANGGTGYSGVVGGQGSNSGNGTASGSGTGFFSPYTYSGGAGGGVGSGSGVQGAQVGPTVGTSTSPLAQILHMLYYPAWLNNLVEYSGVPSPAGSSNNFGYGIAGWGGGGFYSMIAGQGGGGAPAWNGSGMLSGGAGGASPVANGGSGAGAQSYAGSGCTGCSGGGGAGVIYIISENPIPALNIQAKGGNGGNNPSGVPNVGGGGGGGGGAVIQYAPSSSATISVTGGTAGTGGVPVAVNGNNGISVIFPLNI